MACRSGRWAIKDKPGRAGSIDGDADALIATLYDEHKIIARFPEGKVSINQFRDLVKSA